MENDFSYDVLLHNVIKFNQNLRKDRYKRIPFIDNATGIAQRPHVLLNSTKYRLPTYDGSQYARYMPVHIRKTKRNLLSHNLAVKYEFFANKIDQIGNSSLPDDSWRGIGDDEIQNSWGIYAENEIDSENSDYDKDDSFSMGGSGMRRKRRGALGSTSVRRARGRLSGVNPRRKTQLTPTNSSSSLNPPNMMNFNSPYLEEIEPTTPQPVPQQTQEMLKPGNGQIVVFTCNICKSRYKSKAGLNYHMNSQHPQILMHSPGRGRASIIQNYFTQELINDSDFVPNNNQTHGRKSMTDKLPNNLGMQAHSGVTEDTKIIHQLQQRLPHNLAQRQSSQQSIPMVEPSQVHSSAAHHHKQIPHQMDIDGHSYLANALRSSSPEESDPPTIKRVHDQDLKSVEPSPKKIKPSIKEQMIDQNHAQAESRLCDFCTGNVYENKKTNKPENMIQCSDCSRCAHLSCLKFNKNMTVSVGTYHWQCLECKTCWLCETSENDEEMLFCDDCDRGYHMYCLKPAISSPPDGSWSCNLCLERFRSEAASLRPKHKTNNSADSACDTIKID